MNFKVGGKIGYLRPDTGKYSWGEIEKISPDGQELLVKQKVRITKHHHCINRFVELTSIVEKYLVEPSKDFNDGRFLLKYELPLTKV